MPTLASIIGLCLCIAAALGDTLQFNSTLGSHMVLQQSPAKAALNGTVQTSGGGVAATIELTLSPSSGGAPVQTATATSTGGGLWQALLTPMQAGGNYSITANCTQGCAANTTTTITDVTFGDVWYCSGQSNMALNLQFTFARNASIAAIQQGKYSNVRLQQLQGNMNGNLAWTSLKAAVAADKFLGFSATCYYFGESLTDELGEQAPPLGLVHTAWGGSTIEQWLLNSTNNECAWNLADTSASEFHYSRVLPYVGMTIKGFLWYQVPYTHHK